MTPDQVASVGTAPLSVLLLTHNEDANVGACLSSIHGWATDIHVVDSGSTDQTLEIVGQYTRHVYRHEYVDHASQLAWALRNVAFANEWVLLLDADHVVTETLRREVNDRVPTADPVIDGFYVVHQHLFRGQTIHGVRAHRLQIVRVQNVAVDSSELVDFRLVLRGKTASLRGAIIDHNRKEEDIDFWIDKHQRFSTRMAAEEILRREGILAWSFRPRIRGNADERITWLKDRWYRLPLYVRPFAYFTYRFFVLGGLRDGRQGLIFHLMQAFWFRFLVDIKMDDLYRQLRTGELTLEDLAIEYTHSLPPIKQGDVVPTPARTGR